ncbi:MAG: sigma-70 family RNA polymerase sigma factor [Chitinophagaceae bacterium]|nr:sigma-70 family RNA polymerase sigma factor [Chitinophagaceae bacterium]
MKTAAELTERLRHGNQEALFSLMGLYYNDLYRYGMKFTADRDLTKDIIGQFFLHIWDHRQRISTAENIQAYLLVSFRHFIIQHLRRIVRQLDIVENENEALEYSYEDYLIAAQENEAVRQVLQEAIASLPARQKQLIQLRFYDQLSCEEIAIRTSLSIRTVYNKLHEAVKNLRSHARVETLRNRLLGFLLPLILPLADYFFASV